MGPAARGKGLPRGRPPVARLRIGWSWPLVAKPRGPAARGKAVSRAQPPAAKPCLGTERPWQAFAEVPAARGKALPRAAWQCVAVGPAAH